MKHSNIISILGTTLVNEENNKFITIKSPILNLTYPNIKPINPSNLKSNKPDSNKDFVNKLLSNIKIYTSWKNSSISTCVNLSIIHFLPRPFLQSFSKKSLSKYLNIKDKIKTLHSGLSTQNHQSMSKINSKITIKSKNSKKAFRNTKISTIKMELNLLTEKNTLLNWCWWKNSK